MHGGRTDKGAWKNYGAGALSFFLGRLALPLSRGEGVSFACTPLSQGVTVIDGKQPENVKTPPFVLFEVIVGI